MCNCSNRICNHSQSQCVSVKSQCRWKWKCMNKDETFKTPVKRPFSYLVLFWQALNSTQFLKTRPECPIAAKYWVLIWVLKVSSLFIHFHFHLHWDFTDTHWDWEWLHIQLLQLHIRRNCSQVLAVCFYSGKFILLLWGWRWAETVRSPLNISLAIWYFDISIATNNAKQRSNK